MLVGTYAAVNLWLEGRNRPIDGKEHLKGRQSKRGKKESLQKIKVLWVVPVVYGIVAGVEAVLAGSVVGLMLGAVYNAGGFRVSTWIPFVWSLVSVLVLIVSSFSIQGGL